MRVLQLAWKDISQVLRDLKSLLFLVAMPIVFTFFMGFAFRGTMQAPDPRLALGWINHDPDGQLSAQLYSMLSESDSLRLVETGLNDPDARVRRGDVAGVLVVPADFSARVLAGESAQLVLIADELSATGQSLNQLLRGPLTRLMTAAQIARLDVDLLAAQGVLDGEPAERSAAFTAAAERMGQDVPIEVEQAVAPETGPSLGDNPYNQTSPGILVQFAIFGLVTSAQILVQERKTRTLQRLITTNLKPWQIIAGHLLAMFAVGFLQIVVLIVFGQLVLGVNYLREPVGTLLISVALAAWVSSMGLLIGVFVRGEEQVILFSLIAMFVFTPLGGAWFPLEIVGRGFATVGRLTPAAWAMAGYQHILIRGLGLRATLLPAGILAAYALAFFLVAVWRFRGTQER